ncbi:hypothetical protein B0I37DRAFT_417490 [Chaetomium sp. MPI-CAGE-AT-0009]|nr:hypothetical protein B0I37DRAFT_417490 [Chaetomium sp. MPI-CAGE-AT-0009]
MCVTSAAPDPDPATTNVGLGQCAGTARAGAEINTHAPQRGFIPASVAAAAAEGDDAAGFDVLFCAGAGGAGGDYTAHEDGQQLLQEFVSDPEGRSVAVRRLGGGR